jgi:cobalamin biosynthesis Co2+ chelatase CbiK
VKRFFLTLLVLSFFHALDGLSVDKQEDINRFLNTYSKNYQDLIVQNQVIRKGYNICGPRYELLKIIFDLYQKPFTVLDIGAAQGYFDFRTAYEYPHATCVMVENNTPGLNKRHQWPYRQHGDMLFDICHLNNLNNVTYLQRVLTKADIERLVEKEHFDVVLAFLVIHCFPIEEQFAVVDLLLKLGDNVIIEVANDVGVDLSCYVEEISKKTNCIYMGELMRMYQNPLSTGKFFWFRNKSNHKTISSPKGISEETFIELNGVYP